jgi:phage baseplate assembly protein W
VDKTFLNYPFATDGSGRTATTDSNTHIRQMIEQVLFTNPGERVNRPDFGCGLKRLVFMPNSQPLAAATQVLVKSALQKWLELLIQVEKVDIATEDERLTVTLVYVNRTSGERQTSEFTGPA